MLYTVLMLVSNIEDAFNEIWQVKKSRSVFRTFTDYLAMFFVFPILIVVSSGLSIFITAIADQMPDFLMLGPAVRTLIDFTPYVLMSLLFIALYVFMPNTRVKVRSVIVPGILAGIAMQLLQYVYINSQMFLSSYNAIYGSFAALPLFMLWMQISWVICLFGAELCYTNQYLDYYDYDANAGEISHRYRMMLCALIMGHVCRRFIEGGRPYTLVELREKITIPIRFVTDLVYELIDARMLVEINKDDKSEESRFMPAEDTANMTLGMMIDRLESKGTWKIDLDVRSMLRDEWRKVIALRSSFMKQARTLKLQEL
jgi:membrane protein